MSIRGTESFIYYTDNKLGSGSSGTVYFGRHKRKGDACAVKIFMSGRSKIQQNELQLMRRLNHENVVQLLAIEKDSRTNNEALIMEYCSEGSLQNFLKKPQNVYGFENAEMIDFCRQFASGLKYLWTHGITHRDIKPGNILCSKLEDNKMIYKITDFGSSKEYLIQMNQNGLYGTEEYLHPKIFHHIMMHKPLDVNSNEMPAEIWAVGVTIYQVACGKLPFTVPDNRTNKMLMYNLLQGKKSGDISGVHVKDQEFQYSKTLPTTCLLSKDIQSALVDLISRSLEINEKEQLNYETFFPYIENLTESHIFYTFQPMECKLDEILVQKKISDTEKENILKQKFPDAIYFHSDFLNYSNDLLKTFTRSSYKHPVVIIPEICLDDIKLFNDSFETQFVFPKYPKSREYNLPHDHEWARHCCCFLHRSFSVLQKLERIRSNYDAVYSFLFLKFHRDVEQMRERYKFVNDLVCSLAGNVQSLSNETSIKWTTVNRKRRDDIQADLSYLQENLVVFEEDVKKVESGLDREELWRFDEVSAPDKQLLEAETFLKSSNEILENFGKDKHRSLSYNDDQIHKLQRSNLETTVKSIWNMAKTDSWMNTVLKRNSFSDHYLNYFSSFNLSVRKGCENIQSLEERCKRLVHKLIYFNNDSFWKPSVSSSFDDVEDISFKYLTEIVLKTDEKISALHEQVKNIDASIEELKNLVS